MPRRKDEGEEVAEDEEDEEEEEELEWEAASVADMVIEA